MDERDEAMLDAVADALAGAILDLLTQRAPGASICPSEAARRVGGEAWRPLMPAARRAAGDLVARGLVEITQRGAVVHGDARGPIRIRARR